jgi:hypothetical protein
MILSETEIASIIKDNPGRKRIADGCEYLKKMRLHLYGEKLDLNLPKIEGFERDKMQMLRSKYAKSNKDLFARLSRPIDKVFTAKGGSVYYNLSDAEDKKARDISQNISSGLSVRKWVETFWKPHMIDDPFGITLMEILPETAAVIARNNSRSFVVPVYKPITSIYDYSITGSRIDWIVLTLTKQEKKTAGLREDSSVFRVIDDAFDYYVTYENNQISVLSNHTLPNYFGEVPAMLNSDIVNPAQEGYFISFFDEVIELANHFLLKGSIKVTHDFLHGFPKYSEFVDDCPACLGSAIVDGKICKDCSGTGKKRIVNVSDIKLLKWPSSKEEPLVLPSEVGAYVSPDKTYHEIATYDIAALEDLMYITLWGTQNKIKTSGALIDQEAPKTATEIMDSAKPIADRLGIVSEMAEKRHKMIVDYAIRIQIRQNYQGASINYGRRYLLESADAIWERYIKARGAGAPQNVLDTMLNEYYDANYQSDPLGLEVAKKLMYVEPFVHYTAQQIQSLNVPDEDYAAKLYYGEWLGQVSESEIILSEVKKLKEKLYQYTAGKAMKQPEPAL